MTGTQLNTLINYKCRTTDTTFTQADKLVLVNLFKDEIASLIVERNAGYFLIPTTFDLVASSTSREYSFDDTMLNRMHKLELKFTSTDARQPSRFVKDYSGSETESEIVKYYSNIKGGFAHYVRRRSLFILSGTIIAVTGGGRLWWHKYPADLANLTGSTGLEVDPSTTTFGFPRQFHELLATRVAVEFKSRQPNSLPLGPTERNYKSDLQDQLNAISSIDNSGEIIGLLPSSEDKIMGNDGFNY